MTNDGKPFEAVQYTPCCMDWTPGGVSTPVGWPLVNQDFLLYVKLHGAANMGHRRFGPFLTSEETEWAGTGGPKTDAFWAANRETAYWALRHDIWLEDVPLDSWGFKYSQAGGAYVDASPEAIAAFGHTWHPEHEAHLRRYVSEMGCYGNTIVALDNEGELIRNYDPEFYRTMLRRYRALEAEVGCGFVHMVGTSVHELFGEVDYSITHNRAALTAPIAGRWTINNEHNPQFDPNQEVSYFKQAREKHLAFGLWRAEASQADYEAVMAGVKAVVEGQPAPGGCFAPPSDDPNWGANVTGAGQKKQAVLDAEAAVGERCGSVPPHENGDATLDLLGAELRSRGECASRNSDAIFILAPDGKWEEYHSLSYATGCWSTNPAVMPKYRWTYNGAAPAPACPIDVPPVTRVDCKQHVPASLYDCTPKANGVPVMPEGDPNRAACELKAAGGAPSYSLQTLSGALSMTLTSNPWQVRIEGHGTGLLTCHVNSSPNTLCNLAVDR